jgi:hypothetical protein
METKLRYVLFFLIISAKLFANGNLYTGKYGFTYVSPMPGSDLNSPQTNIILKSERSFSAKISIAITGSQSGEHSYKALITDGGRTLIAVPENPFKYGEPVEVKLTDRITRSVKTFSFKISSSPVASFDSFEEVIKEMFGGSYPNFIDLNSFVLTPNPEDSLPEIYTSFTHETNKGYLFISNIVFNQSIPNKPHLLILNNYGQPIWYRRMPANCFDFKVQNGNMFTYYLNSSRKFFGMDLNFAVVDSFYCGNGYSTDTHELIVLPNGNALLMSYDPQIIDMRPIIQGGDSAAIVIGLIIQEIDGNKNVVFQWRSWDHFQINDATHVSMTAPRIDYVHGNSIEYDYDGHLIISSRHMDEITKINRQTGQIIWRLGGKNNQFNFTNDPLKFSYQHSARRLPNGNLMLYDNGNYHSPQFSRAVEYQLDEVNKIATLVWEWRNEPPYYGNAMGSIQRLSNGNTLIGWGSTNPTLSEVRPNGTKSFELTFPSGVFSYRAFRQMWDGAPVEIPRWSTISQNFPNPFNSTTTIRYELERDGNVIVRLYNILGQEVRTLVNEFKEAGVYYVDFESTNLSSGVYFYSLIAGDFVEARRMIILK